MLPPHAHLLLPKDPPIMALALGIR